MLAALNITAIGLGLGAGGLTATIVALLVGGGLSLTNIEDGASIGLVVGIGFGFVAGGWVAGTMARHSGRFHGAIADLLLAAVIVVVARMGGSPAETLAVVWLFGIAALLGGISGWLAGRRQDIQS